MITSSFFYAILDLMKQYGLILVAFIGFSLTGLHATTPAEKTYQELSASLNAISSTPLYDHDQAFLSIDALQGAASTHLPKIESMILSAFQHPHVNPGFLTPYLRLWILGTVGPQFLDINISNTENASPIEIEPYIFLANVTTRREGGKTYWIPLLINTSSKRISLFSWEQCQGKCFATHTVWNTAHGICGKWEWDPDRKVIRSFCGCGGHQDCGTLNTYILQAGTLVLLSSLRKRKCDGKPFLKFAKPCCVR